MSDFPDWRIGVIGDAETSARLSPARQIEDMIKVEAAFARALGRAGVVAPDLADKAAAAIEAAKLDYAQLAAEAAEDGMPVPPLSRQMQALTPEHLHPAVHTGLTSQDVMDNALLLALADILTVFEARLDGIRAQLDDLNDRFGDSPLMGRTRMQAALPITVGHRIENWQAPLQRSADRLQDLRPDLLTLQLGGPVGTREGIAAGVSAAMAEGLGLNDTDRAWHSDRSRLVELGGWLALLTGHLGKIGHDLALMAQQGVDDAQFASGGRSSAMAHKVNPVRAETLVAFARYVSAQLSAMNLTLDHEQERSGATWTLEWMVLPQMLQATGAALLRAGEMLGRVTGLGDGLKA